MSTCCREREVLFFLPLVFLSVVFFGGVSQNLLKEWESWLTCDRFLVVSPGFTQEGFKLAKKGCNPILEDC